VCSLNGAVSPGCSVFHDAVYDEGVTNYTTRIDVRGRALLMKILPYASLTYHVGNEETHALLQ
jgi:hypothetical protein